jgi:hypothetical protein
MSIEKFIITVDSNQNIDSKDVVSIMKAISDSLYKNVSNLQDCLEDFHINITSQSYPSLGIYEGLPEPIKLKTRYQILKGI